MIDFCTDEELEGLLRYAKEAPFIYGWVIPLIEEIKYWRNYEKQVCG